MKIAFFTNGFPIMSEPFIALSAASLIERGHHVDIYGFSYEAATGFSSSQKVIDLLEGRYQNAAWPQNLTKWGLALPKALSVLKTHGALKHPFAHPGIYRRSLKDLSALYQADILPRNADYDILHCHFATLAEGVLKHRHAGLLSGKVVVHFRGFDISDIVYRHGRDVYDYMWGEADYFIANCEFFRDRILQMGAPAERTEVIGSAIQLENFPYTDPLPWNDGEKLELLTVGRLTHRKGIHTAIRSLAVLKSRNVNARLSVIGEGPMREELTQLAHELDVSEQVLFCGAQPHDKISGYLARTHIFLASSMVSKTGGVDAPVNTIKEAMASGVPVVATKHGGIPELVKDNETGKLARENDPEDLGRAVIEMIEMQPQWKTICENARKRVFMLYENKNITDKYISTYERVLKI